MREYERLKELDPMEFVKEYLARMIVEIQSQDPAEIKSYFIASFKSMNQSNPHMRLREIKRLKKLNLADFESEIFASITAHILYSIGPEEFKSNFIMEIESGDPVGPEEFNMELESVDQERLSEIRAKLDTAPFMIRH